MECLTEKFNISQIFIEKNAYNVSPEYQRVSGVWSPEKKQLFLDSLFNRYDVPKIYLHALPHNGGSHLYALVDGKQRLQCIWDFMENEIPLGPTMADFVPSDPFRRKNRPYPLPNDRFKDMPTSWQEYFKGIGLSVVIIKNAEKEDIEELFSRLNNGEPLNAAEKRNAYGGKMCALIRTLSKHKFFKNTISVPNKRYQHYDLTARFLLIEKSIMGGGDPYLDLKKRFLDRLAKENSDMDNHDITQLKSKVDKQLNVLCKIFNKTDPLLRKASYPQLYYLFAKQMEEEYAGKNLYSQIKKFIGDFDKKRQESLKLEPDAKTDEAYGYLDKFELRTQQANDKESLRERVEIMVQFFLQQFPDTKLRDSQRSFNKEERYAIYVLGDRKCAECGYVFHNFKECEADHKTPWAHGGKTSLKNARALCRPCNAKSNARIV